MPASAETPAKPARQRRRGHGSVTLQHVAEAAGVTAITVSRYLRDPARVAEPTALRVRAALRSTGYVPNKPAGGLASGVSRVVAALLPNLTHSIFAETAQGLSDALQPAGHQLLIAATGYSPAREEEQLRALLGWRPAGVIVTGRHHSPGASKALAAARDAGVAVVEIWDCPSPSGTAAPAPAFCQVGFSHEAVGCAMADHLLGCGHRRLAYVDSAVAADRRARERGSAFEARAREAGAEVLRLVSRAGDPFDAGRAALHELLAADGLPVTAAAFANDHLACGSSLEATRCGVAVPGRLALLGFGDFPLARQLQPALSSVSLPLYDIGLRAAGALLALHRGEPVVPIQVLPWAVVARGSTADPGREAGSR
jgi:LacI family gluconate utilization system Gnt-I transcriptional repressor